MGDRRKPKGTKIRCFFLASRVSIRMGSLAGKWCNIDQDGCRRGDYYTLEEVRQISEPQVQVLKLTSVIISTA
jgi:hypothetical protein